jgi:phosphatidylglycerol---prolipoprotein diacylglyceryl transferase
LVGRGGAHGYNPVMYLSLVSALLIKLLCWMLAFSVFLRAFARDVAPADARFRQLMLAAMLGGLTGSKVGSLVFGLSGWTAADVSFSDRLLAVLGDDSVSGALLGARLAMWLADREGHGRREADLLVAPTISALVALAAGAFFWAMRGDVYGVPTDLPWGMDFGDGIARHPVMLYQVLLLGLMGWFNRQALLLRLLPGEAANLFLLVFFAAEVLVGFLRPPFAAPALLELVRPWDAVYGNLMTAEQWVCFAAFAFLAPGWIRVTQRLLAGR